MSEEIWDKEYVVPLVSHSLRGQWGAERGVLVSLRMVLCF